MKRPSLQWYPGDHRRDLGVGACSFEARALWREMMDLMHEGEPYGHLTAGGVPIDCPGLARLIGKPTPIVKRWVDELESRKVFSRTDAGVIYSRRMVRDEAVRNHRAAGGSKSLDNPNVPRPKDTHKDTAKDIQNESSPPSLGGSPSTSTCSLPLAGVVGVLAQALSIRANQGLAEHPTAPQPIPRVIPTSGWAHEAAEEILSAGVPREFAESVVYDEAKRHRSRDPIVSLGYFVKPVLRAWERHTAALDASGADRPKARPENGGSSAKNGAKAPKMTPGEETYANGRAAFADLDAGDGSQ